MSLLYRVRATATGVAGSPFYITQYFLAASSTAQQASSAVADILYAARNMQSGGVTTRMDDAVTIIESTTGQTQGVAAVNPGDPIAAGDSGTPLPGQVQVGVNVTTPTYGNGRRIQGHFSIPSISSSISTGTSGPNTGLGAVTSLQTALDAVVAATVPEWVVFSRKLGTYGVVTRAEVNPRWFTLRSRLT